RSSSQIVERLFQTFWRPSGCASILGEAAVLVPTQSQRFVSTVTRTAKSGSLSYRGETYFRMFTARATTITAKLRLIADCTSMSIFAHRLSGSASVGLNADEFVNDTNR